MKKRRIVLASLLKPVNDTRMFAKMGVSLAKSGSYEVHIIGYPALHPVTSPDVHFHALQKFGRISLARVFGRLEVLQKAIKVKPELLIVTTHELLGVAVLIRIIFGAKIIYDIQENYRKNILFTDAFPKVLRTAIAFFVRLKERVAAPLFSHFFLAEKCYENEIGFVSNKSTILENKALLPQGFRRSPSPDLIPLLFSGTIAESTGVFHAIALARKLHALESRIRLTIIGYCAQAETLKRIQEEVSANSFIALVGGNEIVDHAYIMNAIASAGFGMICYPMSPHIEHKVPTKLFEYLACRLPILLQNHQPWVAMCAPSEAAIPLDFEHPDPEQVLQKIQSGDFYSKSPDGVTWDSEADRLIKVTDSFFRLV